MQESWVTVWIRELPSRPQIICHGCFPKSRLSSLMRRFWFVSDAWKICELAAASFSVLTYRPGQRTGDDLEIIYDELLHIKALAHLSNTVSPPSCFLMKASAWRWPSRPVGKPPVPNAAACWCGNAINPGKKGDRKEILCCDVTMLLFQMSG